MQKVISDLEIGEIILKSSFTISKMPKNTEAYEAEMKEKENKYKTKINKYREQTNRLRIKIKSQNENIEDALKKLKVKFFHLFRDLIYKKKHLINLFFK